MTSYVLAADLGGTKIAVARVDSRGAIDHLRRAPTPSQDGKSVETELVRLLRSLPGSNSAAIGVSVPGLARPDGTVWAPNIPGWSRWPLARTLERRFRLPVVVESDRNCFVTGEAWRGAAKNAGDVVFRIIGTGIGAGILSGGRLLRGSRELAGAVGWMAVRDEYAPRYKQVGCLEAHLAGPGMSRRAAESGLGEISAEKICALARRGNKKAREIVGEAGFYLGLALANLVSTLNPQTITIGGGLSGAGQMLLTPARATMRRWGQPLAVRQVRIIRSRLGARAGLLGAAKLAFDRVGAKNESAAG
ncbi:MAG TPA: ROK family protein [Terriglobia bacterium]|nr:ROK family protein [Terriglobia bacterium]